MIPLLPSASRALIVFCALFFVDRATKISALFLFSEHPYTVIPGVVKFSLYFHTKFFSVDPVLLIAIGCVLAGFFFIAALSVLQDRRSSGVFWVALLAAGAASNLLDAIRYGSIIDWIEIPHLTFFNLADVFIIGGCAGLLFSLFHKKT